MRQFLWNYTLLVAAVFFSLPFSEAFLNSHKHVGRSADFGDLLERSLLFPRDLPGEDEEDETGSGLSACLPKCGEANKAPGQNQKKRSLLYSSRGTCAIGDISGRGCLDQPTSNTTLEDRGILIEKRTLPTGNDDLRRKTRQELGQWITQRIQYGNDVKLIWDSNDDKQYIQLTDLFDREQTYPIPTAFWEQPGNQAFAWGTIGLVGCSLMTAVKVPKENDDTIGVYMGHYWEVPGWDTDEQEDEDGNDVKIMNAQSGAYIYDFLRKGFPHTPMRRRTPENKRDPRWANPTPQDSLTQHANDLKGAFAVIMHPQTTTEEPEGSGRYTLGEGPQHGKTLTKMHDVCQDIMSKAGSNLELQQDYLYRPDRERTRYANTASGRSIFEYQPNFNGRKTGMLLYEDGGEQGQRKADGTFDPGPGGPFFFDFGPAEDTEMPDAPGRKL